MNKEERINFILNNREGTADDLIVRCIKLIKDETEDWDHDVLKISLFNETHLDKIVLLSVNRYSRLYQSPYNTDFLISYYSRTNKMFCFSNKKLKDFDLYKSLLREKILNIILNE